jgi:phosphoheptose isomerase
VKIDNNLAKSVEHYLKDSADTTRQAAEICISDIIQAAELIRDCFQSGGKLMLCGNGGSAADCQHMATEFVSRLHKDFERPGLPAIALTTDTSFLTAFSNDFGFENVFERQVQALGKQGDMLIGISTSGNSTNVIRAVEAAKLAGIKTLALTGQSGHLRELADAAIAVPSDDTQHIQESHLAIEHILCHLTECQVFPTSPSSENLAS